LEQRSNGFPNAAERLMMMANKFTGATSRAFALHEFRGLSTPFP
jgi:hypothetical protein